MGQPTFFDNVRMFISGLAWDVFLWANRTTNEQYWQQEGTLIYVCRECLWVGWERDVVHLTGGEEGRYCPECRGICENMTPEWVVDFMEDIDSKTKAHTSTGKTYSL